MIYIMLDIITFVAMRRLMRTYFPQKVCI